MGKKEQVPALAIFVKGSLWAWSATSRGRPPDGGLALAVFHMVPRVPRVLCAKSFFYKDGQFAAVELEAALHGTRHIEPTPDSADGCI